MRTLLTLMILLGACQWSEDRYAKRAVTRDELIGRWVGTDYSMKSLVDVGVTDHLKREDHVLVLRTDGTCSIRTTFGLGPTSSRVYRSYDTNCFWQLDAWETAHRHRQTLRLTLPMPDEHASFNLAEEDGQLIIWQYATDPDAWRYLEFARSSAGSNSALQLPRTAAALLVSYTSSRGSRS